MASRGSQGARTSRRPRPCRRPARSTASAGSGRRRRRPSRSRSISQASATASIRRDFTDRRSSFWPSMPMRADDRLNAADYSGLGFADAAFAPGCADRSAAAALGARLSSLLRRRARLDLAWRRLAPPLRSRHRGAAAWLSPLSLSRRSPSQGRSASGSAALAARSRLGAQHAARLCRDRQCRGR